MSVFFFLPCGNHFASLHKSLPIFEMPCSVGCLRVGCSGQALDQRTAFQGRQPSSQPFTKVKGKASMSVWFWTQQQTVKTCSTHYTLWIIFQSVFYTVSNGLACLETEQGQVGLISIHIGSEVLAGRLAIEVEVRLDTLTFV